MSNLFDHWFVPHSDNDFKPHILQKAAVIGMTLMVLLSFSVANLQSLLWVTSSWLVSTVLPAVVTEETNTARQAAGYESLRRNTLLDQAATLKAEDMAAGNYFSHWSPTGVSPWYWFAEVGYDYSYAGENLAVHFTDSKAVVEAWLQSPTHKANIISENYTEIGVGTAQGEYEGYNTVFVVQLFGTPAAVAPADEPASSLGNGTGTQSMDDATAAGVPTPVVAGTEDPVTEVTDDGTMVLESFAATTGETSYTTPATIKWWERLATSPRMWLQITYSIIGLFVLGALSFAMLVEWRRHHPVQIAYSVGLLMIMIILFQLHLSLSGGVIIA